MRLVDLGHVVFARGVEGGGREDQDRGIDCQSEHQRDGAVPGRQSQRLALGGQVKAEGAGLHDAGM